ncbi:MAG: elongation factor G, partial [Spirochaetales bacterium]
MDFTTNQIKNIAIAGHGQIGKTTLAEYILLTAGVISKAESTESGKTVNDYYPEEIERKISIHAALSHLTWKNMNINMWDTPGASDFAGEVISAFRSSETILMLVDGRAGAQIETIKLWRDLDRRNKPRIVFVNHLEDERSDFSATLKDIHDKFNVEVCAVTIPMGHGNDFCGVIDIVKGKAFTLSADGQVETETDIPTEYKDAYEDARAVLAGAAAEGDDDLLVKFIDEGELTNEEIERGLIIALENNRIVPVFAGCTPKRSGLVSLLDFIVETVPDPAHAIETTTTEDGETSAVKINSEGAMSALVLKTAGDQFSGRLSYLKIVTGTLHADSEAHNITEGRKEKIGKLYRCVGKKLEEIKSLTAGDIGIATKLNFTKTSETLSSDAACLPFVRLRHPHPIYSVAVSAPNKKDEDKMSEILAKISEEDRTLRYQYNSETKQNVLMGMGELHLNIILNKLNTQNKITVTTCMPRVAYRETVQRKAQAEYTHKKQSGGHGQYGRVVLSVDALDRGEGYKFTNAVFGGAISKSYIPGVEKGIKEAMENGVLAGYPVVDVSVTVLDGKEHPVDSSEMAFKIASRNAFKNAMVGAGAILLEPIMNVTVWVEAKYLGDIMSDMSGKRGRILGQNPLGGGIEEIRA